MIDEVIVTLVGPDELGMTGADRELDATPLGVIQGPVEEVCLEVIAMLETLLGTESAEVF